MSEDYSGALKVAAEALAKEVLDLGGEAYDGEVSEAVVSDATAIVTALAAAGLLLPEGAQRSSAIRLRWYFGEQEAFIGWGCDSLERAREAALEPPSGAVRGEIRRQDIYTTPWSVVEPVALPGAAVVEPITEAADGDLAEMTAQTIGIWPPHT